jgi:ABC-type Mn2+/Zn2+ transport system permease subunit
MLSQFLFEPFGEASVRHSLAAILALSFSAAPIGVFLMLRRMSLIGDAMSHAILPVFLLHCSLEWSAVPPSCKRMHRLRCFFWYRWRSALSL